MIPNGWEEKYFCEIVFLSRKKYNTLTESENLPCIELEHINPEIGTINNTIPAKQQKSIKNYFEKQDVLFGKLRPYLKKYFFPDFNGVCSSEIWVMKCKKELFNHFLYYYIQTENFNNNANKSIGTKMPRADWSYIKENEILLPPFPEQKKIAEILSSVDETIQATQKVIEQTRLVKKGL